MSSQFFQAKFLWDNGLHVESIEKFCAYLENQLNQHITKDVDLMVSNPYTDFHGIARSLLFRKRTESFSLCRNFVIIRQLDRAQSWIDLLLSKDLSEDEYLERDSLPLIDLLIHEAEEGILGPERRERPNGGRSVLPIEEIQQVDDQKWGSLKANLLRQLPAAYARCPPDFWQRRAKATPAEVVADFLHEILLGLHPESAPDVMAAAVHAHIEFAKAVVAAIEILLSDASYSQESLTETVRIDGGFREVDDGRAWLSALKDDLLALLAE